MIGYVFNLTLYCSYLPFFFLKLRRILLFPRRPHDLPHHQLAVARDALVDFEADPGVHAGIDGIGVQTFQLQLAVHEDEAMPVDAAHLQMVITAGLEPG